MNTCPVAWSSQPPVCSCWWLCREFNPLLFLPSEPVIATLGQVLLAANEDILLDLFTGAALEILNVFNIGWNFSMEARYRALQRIN